MENGNHGEPIFTDYEIVVHVRAALQSAFTDNTDEYSHLIGMLHHNRNLSFDDTALLVTTLKALSGSARYIDSVQHGDLLNTIMDLSLWNYTPNVMDALVELITSLAVSSEKCIDACLTLLVSNFTPPKGLLNKLETPFGMSKKENVMVRVHSTLDCIANLVPLAPARLFPVIRERMPKVFHHNPVEALMMFVENIFKLENSRIGEFVGRPMLISAVINLLTDFDVAIDWEDILQEDSSKGIFAVELEEEQIPDDFDEDGGEFGAESLGQKRLWQHQVSDNLNKLDNLMELTLQHLKFCRDNGRLAEVFKFFLHSFQTIILTAVKSKFTQFVIFYACSLDPAGCGEIFAERLADIFFDSDVPSFTRMSALSYLASYLARGKFLPTPSVMRSLKRLIKWCSLYSGSHVDNSNPKAHILFYYGCQAIMYVLCFRLKSILEIPHLNSQLSSFPLRQILQSPLQPLKVCLPSIVEEFIQQAESVNLLDESGTPVFDDMVESDLSKTFGGVDRLDSFFPFDPCLLKRCDGYIRPNFIYWSMVRKTYDEDDEGSSEDDLEYIYPNGNGDELEEDDDLGEFNDTLSKMSITPRGDSFLQRNMEMPSKLRPTLSAESS